MSSGRTWLSLVLALCKQRERLLCELRQADYDRYVRLLRELGFEQEAELEEARRP